MFNPTTYLLLAGLMHCSNPDIIANPMTVPTGPTHETFQKESQKTRSNEGRRIKLWNFTRRGISRQRSQCYWDRIDGKGEEEYDQNVNDPLVDLPFMKKRCMIGDGSGSEISNIKPRQYTDGKE